ncbi:MAG: hypothetical protein BGO69_15270 [Bacteroidetes bacterium 46-16]|nr:MAG: hypothetical protein BGO69_15270 [Bacteroidetes bacterium 46-16]
MKVFIAEIPMKTFIAHTIYSIICDGADTGQYEEQWRLVFAGCEAEALEEARNIAGLEEATFVDRHGRTVHWKLVAVKDLQPVSLEHGSLLYSSVKEAVPVVAPVWAEALS